MEESPEKSNKIVLADFGDWSKPVNTLIEKCADAVGGLFQPHQIIRIAEAEAKAEEIRALAEIKIDRIQRRAATRFIAEETKKQMNMEAIIRGALPQVSDAAKPKDMNDDWVTNFFDKCRLVSDEQMQVIWSKILAGEANTPGRFSKRTVNLISSLDKFEIDLFSSLCRYVISGEGFGDPLVFDYQHPIYTENQVSFGALKHLTEIGLLNFQSLGYSRIGFEATNRLQYFGQCFEVHFPDGNPRTLQLGFVAFTMSAMQLFPLSNAEPVPGFLDYLAEYWKRFGVTFSLL